jgi:hypothetical protein
MPWKIGVVAVFTRDFGAGRGGPEVERAGAGGTGLAAWRGGLRGPIDRKTEDEGRKSIVLPDSHTEEPMILL